MFIIVYCVFFYFVELFNVLDLSIDFCENFYDYVCGGWKKKNLLLN